MTIGDHCTIDNFVISPTIVWSGAIRILTAGARLMGSSSLEDSGLSVAPQAVVLNKVVRS